jgi:SAM-dependent methyltransferase
LSDEHSSSVARFYDQAAQDWDASHADRHNPVFARQFRAALERLLAPAKGAALAVELGAGTGPYIGIVAPLVARLVCTDISSGMLEVLTQRRDRLGLQNVEVLQQDAAKLDGIAEASADALYSIGIFETVAEPEPVFRAARRALRPGGIFASVTSNGDCPWYAIRKRLEGGERAGHIVRYMTPAEVRDLAAKTGFDVSMVECWGLLPPGINNPLLVRILDIAGAVLGATPLRRYLGVLSFRLVAR